MSLALIPLVAAGGALVGSILHEAAHAVAAIAVGELVDVGWQGGLAGGPYVDFRASTRVRSEIVRKAPLALGLVALTALVIAYDGPTLAWIAAAAATLGLCWSSPEDLFVDAAAQ